MARNLGAQVFTGFSGLEAIDKSARQRAIGVKAVRAGGKLVQGAAKSRAPRGPSGLLKRSIGMKTAKGKRGKTLAFAVVGARKKIEGARGGRKIKPSKYAHLVERGTRPHSLVKRVSKKDVAGTAARNNLIAAGRGRKHPGAKPRPFLGPALSSQREAAARAMLDAAAKEIERVLSGVKDRRGGRRNSPSTPNQGR